MSAALATYSADQIRILKQVICPDATDTELALFESVCHRTKLDPFARQIYGVKRSGKLTIQVGIDGFRVVAERTGEMDGQETFWCGPDGQWVDVWLANAAPAAAKVLVYRRGRLKPYVGVARFTEYTQGNSMWQKMPATMLAKCAEALALRKAFPADLSGLYSEDEMAQADDAPPPQARQQQPAALPAPAFDPQAEFQAASNALLEAKNLAALQATWARVYAVRERFTESAFASLEQIKDRRKTAFNAPKTPARGNERLAMVDQLIRDLDQLIDAADVDAWLGEKGVARDDLAKLAPAHLSNLADDLANWLRQVQEPEPATA